MHIYKTYFILALIGAYSSFLIFIFRKKDMYHWYEFGLLLLCLVLYSKRICDALHFRGSMISWRILNSSSSSLIVEIFQRHTWRYDRYQPYCSNRSIPLGQPLLGDANLYLNCISNCPVSLARLGSIRVPCTGYNIGEQYAMGEGRYTISAPINSNFVATFSSTSWFNLVTGNNLRWSVAVRIQTFKRSDTGGYNNAPTITMLPIYRLRNKVSYTIKINVADNDFDPYICLWSQGPTQCGGLINSVPGGIVDNYRCYLNFTPQIEGFYAAALTTQDYMLLPMNISSSNYLSQIPIQFLFHVYSSPYDCSKGPIYTGDLAPDTCIYMTVNITRTIRVRFQVQCANATVDSIITVNPTGLLMTALLRDPFDRTVFTFLASFTSSAKQEGPNLFCFAAVDSIGNQGDSACLRFTVVLSQTSSLQPLYTQNATRYPMGTVSKSTSLWTILTGSRVYVRPTTEAYIRFKQVSDNVDYYVLNVVTATDHVLYYSDRIVINSSVVWSTGESFYIYFDAGALVQASTCSKEAMPISDPNFWPFNIPSETTRTTTTSITTTSVSSITTKRIAKSPTPRTYVKSIPTISASTSVAAIETTSTTTISTRIVRSIYQLTISAIVGISLGCLLVCALLVRILLSVTRMTPISFDRLESNLPRQPSIDIHSLSTSDLSYNPTTNDLCAPSIQYKLAICSHPQQNTGKSNFVNNNNLFRRETLVEVQI